MSTEPSETDEQRADRLETERAHARDDHEYCVITCEAEFTTEKLRNSILWRAAPGSAAMLDELLRRAHAEAAAPSAPADDPTEGLTVQQADALWDAVAIPGPREPSFPEQHERVCRAVAEILAEVTAVRVVVPVDGDSIRDEVLHALDFAYCNNVGYETPEALLDAYDASRAAAGPPAPADRADIGTEFVRQADHPDEAGLDAVETDLAERDLRDRIAQALAAVDGMDWSPTAIENAYNDLADAVLAILPEHTDRPAEFTIIVRDLLDPDPCQLDHHGYCQAHSWMCSGSRCPHARAREVLAAIDSDGSMPPPSRMADEAQRAEQPASRHPEDRCGECGHFRGAHEAGDDPVTPGTCVACDEDDARHDFAEAQQTPPCGPVPDQCADEPCADHERWQAHAEGEHCFCGPECEEPSEAQPSHHRWYVETLDPGADEWAPGRRFPERADAVARYETVSDSRPTWSDGQPVKRRLVRETTSYTVEEERRG
ncbi:hypothetical protein [Streptomyces lasiicapitis]|uniref:hypothetical protein n=1 Tax=Streptomyces lasiicapitis TaxID=1923961 RepID=UPI003696BF21